MIHAELLSGGGVCVCVCEGKEKYRRTGISYAIDSEFKTYPEIKSVLIEPPGQAITTMMNLTLSFLLKKLGTSGCIWRTKK